MSFKDLVVKVKNLVVSGFKKIASSSQAKAFEAQLISILKDEYVALATDAVSYAQALGGSDAAKKANATAKLVQDAEAAGYSLSHSAVNLLIELAVQYLKVSIVAAA